MARSNEPLVWAPFFAGAGLSAMLAPALVLITGILVPLGLFAGPEAFRGLVTHWLTRLLLFFFIALALIAWAHRFRYLLFDLGLKGGRTAVAALCYGSAIAGTVIAGAIALKWL